MTCTGNSASATKLSKVVGLTSSGTDSIGKYKKFGTITVFAGTWDSCCGYLIFNPRESDSGCKGILSVYLRETANVDNSSMSL